jgi:hypothetical protein
VPRAHQNLPRHRQLEPVTNLRLLIIVSNHQCLTRLHINTLPVRQILIIQLPLVVTTVFHTPPGSEAAELLLGAD